jgi:hypothetical protein
MTHWCWYFAGDNLTVQVTSLPCCVFKEWVLDLLETDIEKSRGYFLEKTKSLEPELSW